MKEQHAPGHVGPGAERARVAPLSPERFALQVTIGQETHDKLRYAQALLGHAVAHGDVAQVLDRALDALIHKLEQCKFAACVRTRPGRRGRSANERYVPRPFGARPGSAMAGGRTKQHRRASEMRS